MSKTLTEFVSESALLHFASCDPFDRTTQEERRLIWAVSAWLDTRRSRR